MAADFISSSLHLLAGRRSRQLLVFGGDTDCSTATGTISGKLRQSRGQKETRKERIEAFIRAQKGVLFSEDVADEVEKNLLDGRPVDTKHLLSSQPLVSSQRIRKVFRPDGASTGDSGDYSHARSSEDGTPFGELLRTELTGDEAAALARISLADPSEEFARADGYSNHIQSSDNSNGPTSTLARAVDEIEAKQELSTGKLSAGPGTRRATLSVEARGTKGQGTSSMALALARVVSGEDVSALDSGRRSTISASAQLDFGEVVEQPKATPTSRKSAAVVGSNALGSTSTANASNAVSLEFASVVPGANASRRLSTVNAKIMRNSESHQETAWSLSRRLSSALFVQTGTRRQSLLPGAHGGGQIPRRGSISKRNSLAPNSNGSENFRVAVDQGARRSTRRPTLLETFDVTAPTKKSSYNDHPSLQRPAIFVGRQATDPPERDVGSENTASKPPSEKTLSAVDFLSDLRGSGTGSRMRSLAGGEARGGALVPNGGPRPSVLADTVAGKARTSESRQGGVDKVGSLEFGERSGRGPVPRARLSVFPRATRRSSLLPGSAASRTRSARATVAAAPGRASLMSYASATGNHAALLQLSTAPVTEEGAGADTNASPDGPDEDAPTADAPRAGGVRLSILLDGVIRTKGNTRKSVAIMPGHEERDEDCEDSRGGTRSRNLGGQGLLLPGGANRRAMPRLSIFAEFKADNGGRKKSNLTLLGNVLSPDRTLGGPNLMSGGSPLGGMPFGANTSLPLSPIKNKAKAHARSMSVILKDEEDARQQKVKAECSRAALAQMKRWLLGSMNRTFAQDVWFACRLLNPLDKTLIIQERNKKIKKVTEKRVAPLRSSLKSDRVSAVGALGSSSNGTATSPSNSSTNGGTVSKQSSVVTGGPSMPSGGAIRSGSPTAAARAVQVFATGPGTTASSPSSAAGGPC
ncbi:unnamed protein product [Amoebophrya sp. A25]|nr:unnamed protein product [Amoebophrya sp. A25]|eukprot:GSA25T00001729001.1